MKKRVFYLLLGLEAVLCVGLCLSRSSGTGAFEAVMAFPAAPIGLGLRALSLTGRVGAAAALALYAAVCLVPAAFLLREKSRRRLRGEDVLLGALTVWLVFALYLNANPAKLSALTPAVGLDYGRLIVGGAGWTLLVSWLVLRVLRRAFDGGPEELRRDLGALLALLCFVFVWGACGNLFGGLVSSYTALPGDAGPDRGMLILRFAVSALPLALDLLVTLSALSLLEAMSADPWSEATVARAGILARRCGVCLAAVVVANLAYYAANLLLAGALTDVSANVSAPLLSVCFVLAALLLARVVEENHRLKADSDSII